MKTIKHTTPSIYFAAILLASAIGSTSVHADVIDILIQRDNGKTTLRKGNDIKEDAIGVLIDVLRKKMQKPVSDEGSVSQPTTPPVPSPSEPEPVTPPIQTTAGNPNIPLSTAPGRARPVNEPAFPLYSGPQEQPATPQSTPRTMRSRTGLDVRYALLENYLYFVFPDSSGLNQAFAGKFLSGPPLETSRLGANILVQTFERAEPDLTDLIGQMPEYAGIRDEFARRDYAIQMTAKLTEEVNFARQLRDVRIFEACWLGETVQYDFNRNAFPVGLGIHRVMYRCNGQQIWLDYAAIEPAKARALREAEKAGTRKFGFGMFTEGKLLTVSEVAKRGWGASGGLANVDVTAMKIYLIEFEGGQGKPIAIKSWTKLEDRAANVRNAVAGEQAQSAPTTFHLPE